MIGYSAYWYQTQINLGLIAPESITQPKTGLKSVRSPKQRALKALPVVSVQTIAATDVPEVCFGNI